MKLLSCHCNHARIRVRRLARTRSRKGDETDSVGEKGYSTSRRDLTETSRILGEISFLAEKDGKGRVALGVVMGRETCEEEGDDRWPLPTVDSLVNCRQEEK